MIHPGAAFSANQKAQIHPVPTIQEVPVGTKMAKLFKHLGFGGKKTPPQPPKPDYSGLKQASLDSPTARSPTEPGRASFSGTAGHIADLDSTQGSPQRTTGDKVFGGARPKDGGAGGNLLPTAVSSEDGDGPAASETKAPKGASATPPRLLDEYSDPVDLRKQFQEELLLGACAAPVVEDDYSVPYEVKKLFKDLPFQEGSEVENPLLRPKDKGPRLYDDPYDDKGGGSSESPVKATAGSESADSRPKEDYDEPWKWSITQSRLLQSQFEAASHHLPPHFLAATGTANPTPQLKRTGEAVTDVPDSAEVQENGEGEGVYEATQPPGTTREADSDEEGYTHLRDEFKGRPKPPATETQGNYEEPWDLTSKQREIEDKLIAASDRASKTDKSNPAPHESDTRSQEGYEKPWDWKPHQKDDRCQEGYEKPWDWKPHQKDDRPMGEYEEPWDNKAKALERDLIGKPTSETSPHVKDVQREEDTRPPEEYDEPWDSKLKKQAAAAQGRTSGSSSESSPKSGPSTGASSPHHAPGGSKKKQHKLNLDLGTRAWNVLGERVDPQLPLDQQGWYHGSISRVDAETLLRVHKEGSYLVRMSESSKMDFSLSVKSAHGFMHMKIVNRDKRFILGQFSQPFDSIPQMIHHYSRNKLPIKGAEHMSLLHPVINELL